MLNHCYHTPQLAITSRPSLPSEDELNSILKSDELISILVRFHGRRGQPGGIMRSRVAIDKKKGYHVEACSNNAQQHLYQGHLQIHNPYSVLKLQKSVYLICCVQLDYHLYSKFNRGVFVKFSNSSTKMIEYSIRHCIYQYIAI